MRKFLLALVAGASFSVAASAQNRQTALSIDNGFGALTKIIAPNGPGTLTLPNPGPGATILTSTTGQVINGLLTLGVNGAGNVLGQLNILDGLSSLGTTGSITWSGGQFHLNGGAVLPGTTDIEGTTTINTTSTLGTTIGNSTGNLTLTGNVVDIEDATPQQVSINVSSGGPTVIGGTLGVTGATTLSNLSTNGVVHATGGTGLLGSTLIVNADVSNAAAIAYSKLSLGNSIVNSDLAGGVYGAITGLGAQAQALNMNSHQINGVSAPTLGTDAATKGYVDGQVVATTAAGTATHLAIYTGTNAIGSDASLSDASNTLTYSGTSGISASAGPVNTSSQYQIVGKRVLAINGTNGFENVFVGTSSGNMSAQASSDANVAVGQALNALSTGRDNDGIGFATMGNLSSGIDNVAIGSWSGNGISTGNHNTFLGREANANGDYSSSTAVGYQAVVTGSNMMELGSPTLAAVNTSAPFTTGDGSAHTGAINITDGSTNTGTIDNLGTTHLNGIVHLPAGAGTLALTSDITTAVNGAVILAPTTTARNTVTATTNDIVPLTLQNLATTGTADILDLKDKSNNFAAQFSAANGLLLGNNSGGNKQGILKLYSTNGTIVTIAPDGGAILDVNNNFSADGFIRTGTGAAGGSILVTDGASHTGTVNNAGGSNGTYQLPTAVSGTLALTSDITNAVTSGTSGQVAVYNGTNSIGGVTTLPLSDIGAPAAGVLTSNGTTISSSSTIPLADITTPPTGVLTSNGATISSSSTIPLADITTPPTGVLTSNGATISSSSTIPLADITTPPTGVLTSNGATISSSSTIPLADITTPPTGVLTSNGATISSSSTIPLADITTPPTGVLTSNGATISSSSTIPLADITTPPTGVLTSNGATISSSSTIPLSDITAPATGFLTSNGTTISSTTTVNATTLENHTWESPGTIGSTAPSTGAFTSLQVNQTGGGDQLDVTGTTTLTNSGNDIPLTISNAGTANDLSANNWFVTEAGAGTFNGGLTVGEDITAPRSLGTITMYDNNADGFSATIEPASPLAATVTYLLPAKTGGPYTLATTADLGGSGIANQYGGTAQTADFNISDAQTTTTGNGSIGTITNTGDATGKSAIGLTLSDAGSASTGTHIGLQLNEKNGSPAIDINGTPNLANPNGTWSISDLGAASLGQNNLNIDPSGNISTGGYALLGGAAAVSNAALSIKGSGSSTGGHIQSAQNNGVIPITTSTSGVHVTSPSVSNATDVAGKVTFTTSSATNTDFVQINFGASYHTAPIVVFTPADATTASNIGSFYVTPSTANFTINIDNAVPNGTYNFFYHVIETQ